MMRLAILGAGGHGQVVAESAEALGWSEIAFFDDSWHGENSENHMANTDWELIGTWSDFRNCWNDFDGAIVAVGDNAIRSRWMRLLAENNIPTPIIIHPRSSVSRYARVGAGTVVFAGTVINARTQIGSGCIINSNATVEHDCHIADAVHVCPGANLAGGVRVGCQSWIGVGATIKELVEVGDGAIVGAGAVVIDNVLAHSTVVGVPARVLNRSSSDVE